MKLGRGQYKNFASYQELDMNFSNLGLTLLSGSTGAGKSSLLDAPTWCLFGETSKEGTVEQIRSWGCEEPTRGIQQVHLGCTSISVHRTRGKPSDNDLYWIENTEKIRGKDINDTQVLLEKRLGVTADTYFSACYFHQFSKCDTFFISKAKERRAILEIITDLSFPIQLSEGASNRRKEKNKELAALTNDKAKIEGILQVLIKHISELEKESKDWEKNQKQKIKGWKEKSQNWEAERKQFLFEHKKTIKNINEKYPNIEHRIRKQNEYLEDARTDVAFFKNTVLNAEKTISDILKLKTSKCNLCKSEVTEEHKHKVVEDTQKNKEKAEIVLKKHKKSFELIQLDLAEMTSVYTQRDKALLEIEALEKKENIYESFYVNSLSEKNTTKEKLEVYIQELNKTQKELQDIEVDINNIKNNILGLTQLYDLSFKLRGKLLENAVQELEYETNEKLEKYFDKEIAVEFSADSDSIQVKIQKSGNCCDFKQLSGGQRCLLKLCFGLSIMEAVANKAGVHFSSLFFDESLNGLDSDLKAKAFVMFQELEKKHSTILLIDHSEEFKNEFQNVLFVTIEGDKSRVFGTTEGYKITSTDDE